MKSVLWVLTLAWLLPAWALAATDIEKVSGAIRIEAGQATGKLSTVNGAVLVGADCVVASAETVNGEISLGARTRAGSVKAVNGGVSLAPGAYVASIETVNGQVTLADGARVKNSIATVNGAITLSKRAQVAGRAKTVNGKIILAQAASVGAVETTQGDIEIGANARAGSILVRKASFSLLPRSARKPRVVIGPGAQVTGPLTFEREADLYVGQGAKLGTVTGATPQFFKGDRPPESK